MTSLRTATALLAGCLLAVTACSSGGSSTPPAASEADVVAWMDKVCGAVNGTVQSMSDEPKIDMNDPSALKAGLSEWLNGKVAAIDRSIADLKALENGPHPKSKELATAAENGLGQAKTLLADTRSKLDSTTDATQIIAAFTEMLGKAATMDKTGAEVQKKFDETGLGEVSKKAANCKGLAAAPAS